jgi:hypothetical protein
MDGFHMPFCGSSLYQQEEKVRPRSFSMGQKDKSQPRASSINLKRSDRPKPVMPTEASN